MKGIEVFSHSDAFVEKASTLLLPLLSWRVLHSIDGSTDVDGLVHRLALPKERVYACLEELKAQGWIEELLIGLQEFETYLERTFPKVDPPAGKPDAPAKESPPSPPPPPPKVETCSPSKPLVRQLRLSRVIDFLMKQAPSSHSGQATVYLVFSRVPRRLLEAAGISSIALVDDQTVIRSPELQNALAAVTYSVTQERLPETLFELV